LMDLVDGVPASERYSFSFDGNAQELDHVLVTTGPQNRLTATDLQYGRMDADFPEIYRNDPNRPERVSDHDPIVAYFSLAATRCDANGDGVITQADLVIIRNANGQAASGPDDARDGNGDGAINVADVRYCQLRLTRQ